VKLVDHPKRWNFPTFTATVCVSFWAFVMTYRIVSHLFSYRNEFTTDEALHIRTIAYNCTIMYLLKELAKNFMKIARNSSRCHTSLYARLVRPCIAVVSCDHESWSCRGREKTESFKLRAVNDRCGNERQTLVETPVSQIVRRSDCGLREPRTEQLAVSLAMSALLGTKHVSHSSSRRILRSLIVLSNS